VFTVLYLYFATRWVLPQGKKVLLI
jgi:hypothetical protein